MIIIVLSFIKIRKNNSQFWWPWRRFCWTSSSWIQLRCCSSTILNWILRWWRWWYGIICIAHCWFRFPKNRQSVNMITAAEIYTFIFTNLWSDLQRFEKLTLTCSRRRAQHHQTMGMAAVQLFSSVVLLELCLLFVLQERCFPKVLLFGILHSLHTEEKRMNLKVPEYHN